MAPRLLHLIQLCSVFERATGQTVMQHRRRYWFKLLGHSPEADRRSPPQMADQDGNHPWLDWLTGHRDLRLNQEWSAFLIIVKRRQSP